MSLRNDFFDKFLGLSTYIRRSVEKPWYKQSAYYSLSITELFDTIGNTALIQRAYELNDESSFFVCVMPRQTSDAQTFPRLINRLNDAGITRLSIYKDNNTEEIFIYIHFDQITNTDETIRLLNKYINGVNISGIAASNPSFTAGPIPFPLQDGFVWLNKDQTVKLAKHEISLEGALALFLADSQSNLLPLEPILNNIQRSFCQSEVKYRPPEAALHTNSAAIDSVNRDEIPTEANHPTQLTLSIDRQQTSRKPKRKRRRRGNSAQLRLPLVSIIPNCNRAPPAVQSNLSIQTSNKEEYG